MKNTMPRTLEEMHNRQTRYEVAVTAKGQTFIANYMVRRCRDALIAVARDNNEFLLKALGDGPDLEWSYSMKNGLEFAPGVRVYYTGRTEGEARMEMGV